MKPLSTRPTSSRESPYWRYGTVALWLSIPAVVVPLALGGHIPAIPYDVYADAARRWQQHQALYDLRHIDGFQYFPHTALLFVPFERMGWIGEVLWRLAGWTALASGLTRLFRLFGLRWRALAMASLFVLPVATGSLGNGQGNLPLAALMLHGYVELVAQRWRRAAAILTLGAALKPLMLVPLGLAFLAYGPLRIPLLQFGALTLVLPFLFGPWSYVVTQFEHCIAKLRISAQPDRDFEDLRSLLHQGGIALSAMGDTFLRVAGAGMTVVCTWSVRRKLPPPAQQLALFAFASIYLMLLNPRTQPTSFVLAAPFFAALFMLARREGKNALAMALFAGLAFWNTSHHIAEWVAHWLKPIGSLICLIALLRWSRDKGKPRPLRDAHDTRP